MKLLFYIINNLSTLQQSIIDFKYSHSNNRFYRIANILDLFLSYLWPEGKA